MRQEHRAGEKLFVDFSGDGIPYFDPLTRGRRIAQLFVAALGASSLTYAEATRSQELEDWIGCHVHAYEFFGGATQLLIPDQTKTAVTKSCRYEPLLNRTYQDFAQHYSSCIVPARPRRPRDKAKVEAAVLLAQRWIIASLRRRTFYSIGEINAAIRERLEILNGRKLRKLRRSRGELFEEIDRPKLLPLPAKPFEYAEWKIGVTVNLDYHIEFERNYYSVPYQLAHEPVDVRSSATVVEIFHEGRRVASHRRARGEIQHVTVPEHMSSAHRAHAEWTPSRLVAWARKAGPSTALLVETILKDRPHPEQGYRTCLGIIRLEKRYTPERLEKASQRALACGGRSYRSVEAILRNCLEDKPLPPKPTQSLPLHENVRGGTYYSTSKESES
jgi:transposase